MRIVTIQYLRGLAALLVVVAHNSALLGGGWIKHIPGALGVDVFFIISGFIMTLITHHAADSPVSFLVKRFFRIWPPLFLAWLLSFIFVYGERSFSKMACTLYFCLQDYSQPGPTFGYSALGPPWTLTYEIIFYFVFAVSMSISYRYRSVVCMLIFLATMAGFQLYYNGSFSLSAQVSPELFVKHWWQAWVMLVSNTIIIEFIFGMMLAELMVGGKINQSRYVRLCAQAAIVVAPVYAVIVGPQVFGLSGGFWVAAVIMTAVIILSRHHDKGNNRPLIFLGDISYSLYLIHYSVMLFVTKHFPPPTSHSGKIALFALSVAASVAVATMMFKWIEIPSIRLGKKLANGLSGRINRVSSEL